MRSFYEEFGVPLNHVQRLWLRIPATLILWAFVVLPLSIILGAIAGLWNGIHNFLYLSIRGLD